MMGKRKTPPIVEFLHLFRKNNETTFLCKCQSINKLLCVYFFYMFNVMLVKFSFVCLCEMPMYNKHFHKCAGFYCRAHIYKHTSQTGKSFFTLPKKERTL